jgi:DNA-binding transcriptional regulator YdaS (Cro superfamily)
VKENVVVDEHTSTVVAGCMHYNATPFESLQASAARAGSQSALARICGVSQTAVWKWLQSTKRLPAEHCLAVEAATDVSKHLLRPDIYPADLSSISLPIGNASGSVGPGAPTVDFDRATILKRAGA